MENDTITSFHTMHLTSIDQILLSLWFETPNYLPVAWKIKGPVNQKLSMNYSNANPCCIESGVIDSPLGCAIK